MARILVTGAAGFIGSHTVELLLQDGNEVWGIDNYRSGRAQNLLSAKKYPGFRFLHADATEAAKFGHIVAKIKPMAIIHLAALVSVSESFKQLDENFLLNLKLTHILAKTARHHRVPRIVFASSAAVYGDCKESPLCESSTTSPRSPYATAKLASEMLLRGYAASFGGTVVCLRYFNVFGPRQDPRSPYSGVISLFLDRLRRGDAPIINGDGKQTRDFVFVGDVARANLLAATSMRDQSSTVNICSGRAISINRLSVIMGDIMGFNVAPQHGPKRVGDIRYSVGSPTAAKNQLGFVAATSLEEGLRAMLNKG